MVGKRRTAAAIAVAGLVLTLAGALPGMAAADPGGATITVRPGAGHGFARMDTRAAGHSLLEDGGLHVWTDAVEPQLLATAKADGYVPLTGVSFAELVAAEDGEGAHYPQLSLIGGKDRTQLTLGTPAPDGAYPGLAEYQEANGQLPGINLVVRVGGAQHTLVWEPWTLSTCNGWWATQAPGGAQGQGTLAPPEQFPQGVQCSTSHGFAGSLAKFRDAAETQEITVVALGISLGSGAVGDSIVTKISVGDTTIEFSDQPVTNDCAPMPALANPLAFVEGGEGSHAWTEQGLEVTTHGGKAAGYLVYDAPGGVPLSRFLSGDGQALASLSLAPGGSGTKPGMQVVITIPANGVQPSRTAILVSEPDVYAENWWNNTEGVDLGVGQGMGYRAYAPLSRYLAANPDATVTGIGYSLGSGVDGTWTITGIKAGCDPARPLSTEVQAPTPLAPLACGATTATVPQPTVYSVMHSQWDAGVEQDPVMTPTAGWVYRAGGADLEPGSPLTVPMNTSTTVTAVPAPGFYFPATFTPADVTWVLSAEPCATPTPTPQPTPTGGVEPTSTPTPQPTASISHPEAGHGTTVTVTFRGFTPGARVIVSLNSRPLELGTAIADAAGTVTFTFTVPAGVAAGTHQVIARDALTGHQVSVPLTVLSRTAPTATSAAGSLPLTGSADLTLVVSLAFGAVILGLGSTVAARRRSRA